MESVFLSAILIGAIGIASIIIILGESSIRAYRRAVKAGVYDYKLGLAVDTKHDNMVCAAKTPIYMDPQTGRKYLGVPQIIRSQE